jgi:hypothetical protein
MNGPHVPKEVKEEGEWRMIRDISDPRLKVPIPRISRISRLNNVLFWISGKILCDLGDLLRRIHCIIRDIGDPWLKDPIPQILRVPRFTKEMEKGEWRIEKVV